MEPVRIDPGKPWQNGFIESFNGRVRDEFLNGELFFTRDEARVKAGIWLKHYNQERPHSSLGYMTPAALKQMITAGALPPYPRSLALWRTQAGR